MPPPAAASRAATAASRWSSCSALHVGICFPLATPRHGGHKGTTPFEDALRSLYMDMKLPGSLHSDHCFQICSFGSQLQHQEAEARHLWAPAVGGSRSADPDGVPLRLDTPVRSSLARAPEEATAAAALAERQVDARWCHTTGGTAVRLARAPAASGSRLPCGQVMPSVGNVTALSLPPLSALPCRRRQPLQINKHHFQLRFHLMGKGSLSMAGPMSNRNHAHLVVQSAYMSQGLDTK